MKSVNLISFREFEGKKSYIFTIPKGTILFRHVYGENDYINDYLGTYDKLNNKYTLSPDKATYFYFYPYVRDTNKYFNDMILNNSTMMTYITSKDVNVLLLIKPSKYTKSRKNKSNAIISCKDTASCEGIAGFERDICSNPKFKEENPDIVGRINLGYGDNLDLKNAIESGKFNDFKKFIAFFRNADNRSGVFEVSLFPKIKNTDKCIETKLDLPGYDWIVKHLEEFNYFPLLIFPHNLYEKGELYKFLIDSFNPEGYTEPETKKVYHLTIDKRTYFYMLDEVIENDTKKHCLSVSSKNKLKILRSKNSELIFDYSHKILD
jgi:hypothetical protein